MRRKFIDIISWFRNFLKNAKKISTFNITSKNTLPTTEPILSSSFHPHVSSWFRKSFEGPTEVQEQAWPAIKKGKHTLISAPTGSGKTLAAFYSAIDELVKESESGALPVENRVVYISPLKALSNDIHRNLELPLKGIETEFFENGQTIPEIKVAVRTGDTPNSARAEMVKKPPHILVTTPESLYLLLTSDGGRRMLSTTRTIIIDEIHAMLGDKRGSHLALSVERLEALVGGKLQRIGLSATQKPIQMVAKFLVGNKNIVDDQPRCEIVDTGNKRKLDITIEVPDSPLTAVMENEVWGQLYERFVELIKDHKTTLIFVNNRRLSERLAVALAEKVGEEHVTSHHGSMSKEHRQQAEQKLKQGQLKVLVATASMELGIDIGSVSLIIQIASPKSIAAFIQRVGRSNHHVGGIPKGIMFPLTRDELTESVALFDSIRRGELDKIVMPEAPLDILSQQIVAEVSNQDWEVEKLFESFSNAYPYRSLTKDTFLEIVKMQSEGFSTRRGRRGAHVHFDAINGVIRGRKGARIIALTNGGSIPDMFDYDVVLDPQNIKVGTIGEDYALESLPGDTITLGTHTWQILGIEGLTMKVKDATGMPPTIPFWLGEGPGRTLELSESVSRLRTTMDELLDKDPLPRMKDHTSLDISENLAFRWLVDEVGIGETPAEQLVNYFYAGKVGLGVVPTRDTIVLERFFDDVGDMHLVVHSPYGSRLNRGWGLSLRKKFCQSFNFELQAAANEDAIILSLSSSHSFPLEGVYRYLNSKIVRETLIQAMLDAPMFEVRWRWNATRSLAIQRNRNGKRVPPQFQRMNAEDLIAQVFPDQIACFENIDGEREVPDHPLVNQAIHDCLTEAMDIDELEELMAKIDKKELKLETRDLREPSAFAQEIINAKPYAFLDETEFAERRVNAIRNRSWLDPTEANDLSRLDIEAIERVRSEAWPNADSPDELHDVLSIHGFVTQKEGKQNSWEKYFDALRIEKRATFITEQKLWVAAERTPQFGTIYPESKYEPNIELPDIFKKDDLTFEDALKEVVRGRLEALAIVTAERLAEEIQIPLNKIELALISLEVEGFVFRGKFTPNTEHEEWCERRLLHRIHKYTIESLRKSIEPASIEDYMRFLFDFNGLSEKKEGTHALELMVEKMEGYEAPAGSWESDIIPARIQNYDPVWLDVLCLSGKLIWGRFNQSKNVNRKTSGTIKSSPICLIERSNTDMWRIMSTHFATDPELTSTAEKIYNSLKDKGASFFADIAADTKLLNTQVEAGISELVANGLVNSDSFIGLRALLTPAYNKPSENNRRKKKTTFTIEHAGRWTLIPPFEGSEQDKLNFKYLEKLVYIYAKRWGVIFRKVLEKESFAPPWRILVRVLRRMELQGKLRGGRFISGVSGEQFALPEVVKQLRRVKNKPKTEDLVVISGADPLNLLGLILPTAKVSNFTNNRILFQDGIPIAVLENKEVSFLKEFDNETKWELQNILIRREFPPKLRAYLGRNYK
ncbi:MAG: DEAD/DEAH box helicase [Cyclobacteriaceae bacterium]